jgi:hypothetical protein
MTMAIAFYPMLGVKKVGDFNLAYHLTINLLQIPDFSGGVKSRGF